MEVHSLFATPTVTSHIELSDEQAHATVGGLKLLSAAYTEQQLANSEVLFTIPQQQVVVLSVLSALSKISPSCQWSICSVKLNEMTNGAMQRFHMHRDVDAFAVLYLTTPTNASGSLILQDPRFVDHITIDPSLSTYTVPCKRGTLVVAPSYVWHSVDPYFDHTPRYSVVYNAVARRNDND